MQSDTIGTSKAAVPIPVYRELAAELQAAQAKIIQLQNQNDRLTKQNQILIDALETIVNAHNQSQDRISAQLQAIIQAQTDSREQVRSAQERLQALLQPPQSHEQREVVIDEAEIASHRVEAVETIESSSVLPEITDTAPLNRGWLILLICAIVIISFGAGYLLITANRSTPRR